MKWPRVIKTNRGRLEIGKLGIVIRRFVKYLRPHTRTMIVALLATMGAVAMHVASPWPIKIVFDLVLSDAMVHSAVGRWFAAHAPTPTAALTIVCGAILLIAVAESVFAYFRDVLLAQTGQNVVGRLRHDLFRHMQRLSPDVFESRRTGDLLLRLTGDIQMLRQMLVNAWITLGENVLTIVATIAVMFWLNAVLAAVAVATVPLMVWSGARISKRIRKATKSQREKESFVASIAHEVIGAIPVVQAFNREKIELRRFARQNRSSIRAGVRTTRLEARLFRVVALASAAGLCAVLFLGVRSVLSGAMTAGDLLVFVAYVRTMHKPMRKLAKLAGSTAKATTCGLRIAEILSIRPAITDDPDAVEAARVQGRIEFQNVDFVYPDGTCALRAVSLHIAPGESVALVGRNGAGKSTLVKLLLRYYDVTEGAVLIDGRDVRKYTISSLRQQIAVVQQDTVLFGLSVAENIALGESAIDMAEVKKAARVVRAHEFIQALPKGYDTVLSERGVTLSGGQKQRLALTRALLRGSPILVLDEPVTGLDAPTARRVERRLVLDDSQCTRLVICHDLSAMEQFDRIVVLDAGRIAAQGTHRQLVETCTAYAELFDAWATRREVTEHPREPTDAHESERLAC